MALHDTPGALQPPIAAGEAPGVRSGPDRPVWVETHSPVSAPRAGPDRQVGRSAARP